MAVRSISVTDTLETFRTQFNALAANDFGDIATLDPTLSATSVIGAVNELSSQVSASLGIFIEDASSTRQQIGAGQTMFIFGTSNEIEAVVSATDTLTIGLPNNVTIGNNLTVTNDLTVSNTANIGSLNTATISSVDSSTVTVNDNFSVSGNSTLGTIFINGNTINTTDSTTLTLGTNTVVDGTFSVVGGSTLGNVKLGIPGQYDLTSTSGFFSVDATLYLAPNRPIVFEGATADDFETTLRPVDATADRLIFIPNENGTIITTGSI